MVGDVLIVYFHWILRTAQHIRGVYNNVKALKILDFVIILGGRFLISNIVLVYKISIY